ncbi:hypothetical protein H0H92_002880 [Tricholoma furcatifolium]|nr:hypothetical protein H0H92_002880 [Tricholoma furcatifolium]
MGRRRNRRTPQPPTQSLAPMFEAATKPPSLASMFEAAFMREIDPTKPPRFPPEIEHLIFVESARSKPGFAPTLSIVCKRVQTWVEAVIYESLYIVHSGNPDDIPDKFEPGQARDSRIFPTLLSRPAEFFAANVYNLCMLPDVSCTLREVALSKCTSVRHLAIFEDGESALILDKNWVLVGVSFTTVVSLNTTKSTLREMMELEIKLPNVTFLAIRRSFDEEDVVPSLDWLPAVKTVEVYLRKPHGAQWQADITKILATTPQLRELWLDLWGIYHEVEEYVDHSKRSADLRQECGCPLPLYLGMEGEDCGLYDNTS